MDISEQIPEVETRLIKRYANRKLYDTHESSYVTLDDIAELIRAGEEVRVIDNRSKEDLTSVTLAQIIFEQQKTRRRVMPLSALKNIIQGSGEFFQRLGQPVTQLRGEAARQVDKLKRSKGDDKDASETEAGEDGDEAESTEDEKISRNMVMEVVSNLQRAVDDMQRRVDERVRDAVDALTHVPDLQKEASELGQRLQILEAQVAALAHALGQSQVLELEEHLAEDAAAAEA